MSGLPVTTDPNITPGRCHSKTLILSTNVYQTMIDRNRVFDPTGDKWQSKAPFLATFDPRSSIVKSVFDCRLPGVNKVVSSFIS